MAAGGPDEVILSLLSIPKLSIKSCISVLPAVLKSRAKDQAYKIYITDTLKSMAENTAYSARQAGGDGRYITIRYADAINPKPEEKRTGNEIIEMMRKKIADIGGDSDESI